MYCVELLLPLLAAIVWRFFFELLSVDALPSLKLACSVHAALGHEGVDHLIFSAWRKLDRHQRLTVQVDI